MVSQANVARAEGAGAGPSPSPINWNSIVFQLDSDNESVVLITENGDIVYTRPGRYGGWMASRPLTSQPLYLVACKPEKRVVKGDEVKSVIDALPMDEGVKNFLKEFFGKAFLVSYSMDVCKPRKVSDKYDVYDVESVIDTMFAEAVVFEISYYKRTANAEQDFAKMKTKLATISIEATHNLYIVKNVGYKGRETWIRFKVVTKVQGWKDKVIERRERELSVDEEMVEAPEVKPEAPTNTTSTVELEEELEVVAAQPTTPQPSRTETVPIYILTFNLPSGYLGTKEITKNATDEHRTFDARVKSTLEGFRARAYVQMRRIFHMTSLGWVAVTEDAVKEAEELNKAAIEAIKSAMAIPNIPDSVRERLARAFARRYFKAYKVFLEPNDAIEVLEEAIRSMSEDIEEMKQRIQKAKYESQKRQVQEMLAWTEHKMAMFQAKLKEIRGAQ